MKFRIFLFVVSLCGISASLFAKPVAPDSVGVKNNDGKKVILFKVKAKDTYYSIGRRYNIKPEVLMKYNGKKKATLTIGTVIEIPTDQPYKKSNQALAKETKKQKAARLKREAAEATAEARRHKEKIQEQYAADEKYQAATNDPKPVADPPAQVQQVVQQPIDTTPPTQYKVSAGETLYSISKRFATTVDYITQLNSLTSTTLVPGQILLVKPGQTGPPQPVVTTTAVTNTTTSTTNHDSSVVATSGDNYLAEHHMNANRYGLYEKNEAGLATWIDEPDLDPNKKLVLHRTAPIGTVIKITNPMTNRTTFAKVVGRFTDSEATRDVIIVMTKNVADSLGALDKRFRVDLSYGSPNE